MGRGKRKFPTLRVYSRRVGNTCRRKRQAKRFGNYLLSGPWQDADALVAVSPCRSSRKFQCRLEIPLVAVRIERQGHHTPVVPGCRLEILCVEVRVAARIGRLCRCCDDRIECLAAGAHDEFPYAPLWIGIPGGVKGAVAGIEVVVSVQHQVGVVLVEQLPKGLSGRALLAEAVGSAERGLVPVGELCTRNDSPRDPFSAIRVRRQTRCPWSEQPPGCV